MNDDAIRVRVYLPARYQKGGYCLCEIKGEGEEKRGRVKKNRGCSHGTSDNQ